MLMYHRIVNQPTAWKGRKKQKQKEWKGGKKKERKKQRQEGSKEKRKDGRREGKEERHKHKRRSENQPSKQTSKQKTGPVHPFSIWTLTLSGPAATCYSLDPGASQSGAYLPWGHLTTGATPLSPHPPI